MANEQSIPVKETLSSDQLQIALLSDISKKLSKLIGLEGKIYSELLSEADDGEYLVLEKTATTTVDTIYSKDLTGHYIKGYTIQNNGTSTINAGHNADLSKRYIQIANGESKSFSFNRKKIKSIYIRTESGSSLYTLTLQW